jgi:DNA-binding CsgD family transcriptional regulator
MVDAYEKVKHLGPAAMRVTEKPTATIAFNAAEDFPQEELREYREFLHEHRHENFFITSEINPITRFAHWVSLYRFDKEQRCTPEETQFLSCLAPHLMQALAINRLVHLDRLTGDVAREKWAVALAESRRGELHHADKRFRELMRREWPVDGEERLPRPLLDRLMAGDNQITGKHVVIHRSLERGLLFLKARPREKVDELSAREFVVARLLASGLTHKQAAAKLERSPETIRSQARTIFEKLGINHVAMLGPLLVLRE